MCIRRREEESKVMLELARLSQESHMEEDHTKDDSITEMRGIETEICIEMCISFPTLLQLLRINVSTLRVSMCTHCRQKTIEHYQK